ncbi:MAG: hypothetical protein MUF15_19870 [Acidobacteria bacterium]|jgi:tetratricopeptide (TPR) repeat protein|nr:hypothetical protein [Acidobacteriota bacterium]
MNRKFTIIIFAFLIGGWLLRVDLFPAANNNSGINSIDFNKGIAYLLIKDMEQARKFFKAHFIQYPNPNLENGFRLLSELEHQDAARQFSEFLEISPRSTIALVGVSIATSNMSVSSAEELLKRAMFLEPGESIIYLCLGMEYRRQKNYPLAEQNIKQALSITNLTEYKILLGRLYFEMNKPDAVLALLKEEADRVPDNFHLNFMVAQAYFQINRLNELGHYCQMALELQPDNNNARILMANYYLSMNDAYKANLILKNMKLANYHEDYMKTYAHALVLLKDKKARDYLYEIFTRKKWDKDINRLLGLYHLWMGDKSLVQNWIYRAILSGAEINRLKGLFPSEYKYCEYKYIPFFDIKQIAWISESTLLAAAAKESGESEKIYVINFPKMQIIQTLTFNGEFQEMFVSGNLDKLIVCTTAKENTGVYLYTANLNGREIYLQPIGDQLLGMSSVLVGFDKTGNLAYITEHKIAELAFESPFALVAQYGKKKPVYPFYPFPIYKYNFAARSLTKLNELDFIESSIPVGVLKKYALVANAFSASSEVQKLVEKGQTLELTSSEVVKTYFPGIEPLDHFIIYISDLKNAFHGVIWDQNSNRAIPVDETIFLGEGKYSELTIVDFNPGRKEILVLAKNQNELILYNYDTQSSMRLAKNAFYAHYNSLNRIAYVLNERNEKVLFTGSGLQVVFLNPYVNKSVATNKNLVDITYQGNNSEIYFSTMDGEIIKMDEEYNFSYVRPCLDDCLNAVSPSTNRIAAFIGDRLWVIE